MSRRKPSWCRQPHSLHSVESWLLSALAEFARHLKPRNGVWGETPYIHTADFAFKAEAFYGEVAPETTDACRRGNGKIILWPRRMGEIYTAATCEWGRASPGAAVRSSRSHAMCWTVSAGSPTKRRPARWGRIAEYPGERAGRFWGRCPGEVPAMPAFPRPGPRLRAEVSRPGVPLRWPRRRFSSFPSSPRKHVWLRRHRRQAPPSACAA